MPTNIQSNSEFVYQPMVGRLIHYDVTYAYSGGAVQAHSTRTITNGPLYVTCVSFYAAGRSFGKLNKDEEGLPSRDKDGVKLLLTDFAL
jgi:hypothetical protein